MTAIPPISILGGNQAKVNLVYKFRGLHAMATALALHEVMGETPQIRYYDIEKLVFGIAAPFPPLLKQYRDVAHWFSHSAYQYRMRGLYHSYTL
jgi:hypothetical protein